MNTLGNSAEFNRLPSTYNHSVAIKDRKLGNKKETKFHNWLKKSNFFPDSSFDKIKGWSEMDFVDDSGTIYIELKGRRCNKFDFDTTMIGHNKYIKARKLIMKGYKVYFFFAFRNMTCFYPVPIMLPSAVQIRDGGTYKRGVKEIKKHLYIPTSLLFDCQDFNSILEFNSYQQDIDNDDIKFKKLVEKRCPLVNVKC